MITKNLIVNGSARILNKIYCGDLAVSGSSAFGAITATSLSSTGTLSVTGASTLSGAVTAGSTISATGNISSSGSVTGATGLVSTNGNLTLGGKLAASVSGTTLLLGGGFDSGVSLGAKNLATTGMVTASTASVTNAIIGSGKVTGDFEVKGVL